MATNNVRILKGGATVQRFRTEANVTVSPLPGDAIKGAIGTGTNYVGLCLNGDPEQETDVFIGVSKNGGTANTASANGTIDVELVTPGRSILEIKANTAGNVDTDAKILGVLFDQVAFDRSADTAAGTLTIDEDEGTDTDVHGLCILDVRITDAMVYFTPMIACWGVGFGELTQT